jgi:hypothetical protein
MSIIRGGMRVYSFYIIHSHAPAQSGDKKSGTSRGTKILNPVQSTDDCTGINQKVPCNQKVSGKSYFPELIPGLHQKRRPY